MEARASYHCSCILPLIQLFTTEDETRPVRRDARSVAVSHEQLLQSSPGADSEVVYTTGQVLDLHIELVGGALSSRLRTVDGTSVATDADAEAVTGGPIGLVDTVATDLLYVHLNCIVMVHFKLWQFCGQLTFMMSRG